jgi:hypothetical protein
MEKGEQDEDQLLATGKTTSYYKCSSRCTETALGGNPSAAVIISRSQKLESCLNQCTVYKSELERRVLGCFQIESELPF